MEVIQVSWKIFRYHDDCFNQLIRILDLCVNIFQKDDRCLTAPTMIKINSYRVFEMKKPVDAERKLISKFKNGKL